ncbi:hypothetical protein TIFTF001_047956 [Ficus carica]|uniref:Uncharacterized protein n=1 Tax=Ficus carica TaxID=3494 RepID=A0AA88CSE6_FICCA|nr:hypothetical protein TIFTF001_047956 [Ficus carica]
MDKYRPLISARLESANSDGRTKPLHPFKALFRFIFRALRFGSHWFPSTSSSSYGDWHNAPSPFGIRKVAWRFAGWVHVVGSIWAVGSEGSRCGDVMGRSSGWERGFGGWATGSEESSG